MTSRKQREKFSKDAIQNVDQITEPIRKIIKIFKQIKHIRSHKTCCFTGLSFVMISLFFSWPVDFKPKPFRYGRPPAFEGPLKKNWRLSEAQKLHEGVIKGPESIVFIDDDLYTGSADGKILRVQPDNVQVVTRLGGTQSCAQQSGEPYNEARCGRPLGVTSDRQGRLLVADSSLGLFRVNVANGQSEKLVSMDEVLNEHKSKFFNDVTMTTDGMIYVTDSSTRWTRQEFRMPGWELNPDGRVIEYNPGTKRSSVVCDKIYPNGIEGNTNEDYVLVAETPFVRILKCFVRGPRRGQIEIFLDNLPGYPDNIRRSSSGGYWVALTSVRDPSRPRPIWETLAPYPWIRTIIHIWSLFMKGVKQFFNIRSKKQVKRKDYGMVIEVSSTGHIIRSFHDPTGNIVGISHVQEHNGILYLGSANNEYIGSLDLK